MKKKLFLALILCCGILYAQTNVTVSLDDDVYELLQNIELRGYCSHLSAVKPYTEKYIVEKLEEAADYLEDNTEEDELTTEKRIIEKYLEKYEHDEGLKKLALSWRKEGDVLGLPVSIEINDNFNTELSGGFYDESDNNTFAFNIYNLVDFSGDLGEHISYRNQTYLGASKVPLKKVGEYDLSVREEFYQKKEANTSTITTQSTDKEYANMGDEKYLQMVVDELDENYPAEHVVLDLYYHGRGI